MLSSAVFQRLLLDLWAGIRGVPVSLSRRAHTKWEFCLYIKNLEPKVIPDESTIPTYMRYYPAVLSKFACATSKNF